MKTQEIQNYATIIYEYLLKQPDGYRTTTSRVRRHLGIDTDEFHDDWDIHNKLFEITEEKGVIELDMSEHEYKCEGLPFNLDYVVRRKG